MHRAELAIVLAALCGSAAAAATPQRPVRHRTNPERARRALALQRILAEGHGLPDAGGATCDFEFGDCFWWIGSISTATSGVPNSGVRTSMNAVNFQPDGGCFDCWTSEFLDNGYWGQVGFSSCNAPSQTELDFTVFYQTWNADAGVILVDGESTWMTQGVHNFSMALDAGTVWDYSVDGILFGSFDMGSATASGPNAISTVCEEGDGVAQAFVPPAISMPATMQVASGGSWAAVDSALVYNTAGLSGVVGNLQDATLPNDATVVGGSSPYLTPYTTTLWNGAGSGAVADGGAAPISPVYVTLSSPLPNATVSGVVPIVANVVAPAGSSAYFFASDPGPECTLTAPPWTCNWDSTHDVDGGLTTVTVEVQDPSGNLSWADLTVTVDNPGGTSGGTSGGSTEKSSSSSSSGTGSSGGASTSTSTSTGRSSSASSSAAGASSSGGAETATTSATTGPGPGGKPPQGPSCGCAAGSGSTLGAFSALLALALLRRRRQGTALGS